MSKGVKKTKQYKSKKYLKTKRNKGRKLNKSYKKVRKGGALNEEQNRNLCSYCREALGTDILPTCENGHRIHKECLEKKKEADGTGTGPSICACGSIISDVPEKCAVCLEYLDNEYTSCIKGHKFHSECLLPWLKKSETCPMCRISTKR